MPEHDSDSDSEVASTPEPEPVSSPGRPMGEYVGLDEADTHKKRMTCLHLAGSVMVEMAGTNYPVFSKLTPLITHYFSSKAEFISASRHFDESAFSEVVSTTHGALSNVIGGVCAGAGLAEILLDDSVKNRLLTGSTHVMKQHIADNSGWMKIMRGVLFAEPYLTPIGKREYTKILESPDFFKVMNTAYESALAGTSNPKTTAEGFQNLFRNMPYKSFHPLPEFPVQTIESTLAHELGNMKGKIADLSELKRFASFTTPLLTKYLPPLDVASNMKSVHGDWQKYSAAKTPEATADSLAALSCSSMSLLGSAITAFGLNPVTKRFLPKPLMPVALGLMCTGAAGSFFMDRNAGKEAAQIK